jgi:trehalose 6-phosphate synthase/phosphatase
MSRLLVVSNRLPVTVHTAQGRASVTASAGGLATGLRGAFDRSHGRWIGWPGSLARLDTAARDEVLAGLADLRCVPVELTAKEVRSYYEDFSNGVLWPLFHYLLDRIPMRSTGWDAYRRVNEKFADAVVAAYQPGDTVWVHDYHLLLLPGCCASACRTRASASSCTSRSPRPRCSACCRGAPRSSAASSAPT